MPSSNLLQTLYNKHKTKQLKAKADKHNKLMVKLYSGKEQVRNFARDYNGFGEVGKWLECKEPVWKRGLRITYR